MTEKKKYWTHREEKVKEARKAYDAILNPVKEEAEKACKPLVDAWDAARYLPSSDPTRAAKVASTREAMVAAQREWGVKVARADQLALDEYRRILYS